MKILIDDEKKIFLLQTEHTSYGMQVGKTGKLLHLHWGKRIDRIRDLPYDEQLILYPFEDEERKPENNQEYTPSGGYYFDESCLKITYADGCRDTKLFYEGYQLEKEKGSMSLRITLKEILYPVYVHLVYTVYEGLDVIDRSAVIENLDTFPIQLENAKSASCYLPRGKNYRLSHMSGKWAGEHILERRMLTQSKVVLETRNGESGPDSCPWVALDENGTADEEKGQVWAASLHWSGNWRSIVELDKLDQVRITMGINEFDFGWELKSGEQFETPVCSIVYSESGFGEASRRFHRYQRDWLIPQNKAKSLRKVMYNSWEVFGFDIDEDQQMKLAEIAADIGVELFVMDDGWFGERDNDKAGLGDWYPSKSKFPNGLKPLIDKVNQLGMEFGIWVEPEMVNSRSSLYRKHPEWVLHCPGKEITEKRNQYVLNFAREDVVAFVWDFLYNLLSENNIQYLKWDMNRHLCEVSWPEVPLAEQREIWTRYVTNLWGIFDKIQKTFPDVILENCSSGGCRTDFGMLSRSDLVNTSDNVDPLDNLKIFEGYTQVFLPKLSGRVVTVDRNEINMRLAPLSYRLDVCMMQTLVIGNNLFLCNQGELQLLKDRIEYYKEIREVVQNGELYRLISPYENPYMAVEYLKQDQTEAILFVLGQSMQFRQILPRIRLKGLKEDWIYQINDDKIVSGAGLEAIGMDIALTGDMDSHVYRIKKYKMEDKMGLSRDEEEKR